MLRDKIDTQPDSIFYAAPKFVTHVDDHFLNKLTNLYRKVLKNGDKIIDLMSSWISHLPEEISFTHVEGHGMNEDELKQNNRLNHYFIQDFNVNPILPIKDNEYDAALITVSVQYLQKPEEVFSEICRILKPEGVCVVSFSNRMFPTKAINQWRDSSDEEHIEVVENYFKSVKNFGTVLVEKNTHTSHVIDESQYQDPFFALISHKK